MRICSEVQIRRCRHRKAYAEINAATAAKCISLLHIKQLPTLMPRPRPMCDPHSCRDAPGLASQLVLALVERDLSVCPGIFKMLIDLAFTAATAAVGWRLQWHFIHRASDLAVVHFIIFPTRVKPEASPVIASETKVPYHVIGPFVIVMRTGCRCIVKS